MNRRRIILTAFAAIVAATVTTTAVAASGGPNPKTMVLQKSDFPAGARLVDTRLDLVGKEPETYAYHAEWNYKLGVKHVALSSMAMVPSPSFATFFSIQLRTGGLLRPGYREVTLPKYGDEQVAVVGRDDFLRQTTADLYVRKGGVFWTISLYTRTRAGLTKAEAIAQLKLYAPKQMKRVGSG